MRCWFGLAYGIVVVGGLCWCIGLLLMWLCLMFDLVWFAACLLTRLDCCVLCLLCRRFVFCYCCFGTDWCCLLCLVWRTEFVFAFGSIRLVIMLVLCWLVCLLGLRLV